MNQQNILIWSSARTSGNVTQYTVRLPTPVKNCVSVDWVSSSIAGYTVSINEFDNRNTNNYGLPYWKFLNGLVNYNIDSESKKDVKNFNSLTITIRSPDNTVPTIDEHCLEIVFFTK